MIEIFLLTLIVGVLTLGAVYTFQLSGFEPWMVILPLMLIALPGLYAMLTGAPFVPSTGKRRRAMLELAELKAEDVVFDLGCGDGRLVFEVSPHVKKAVGYELSLPLILFGKIKSLFYPHAQIRWGDFWKQDYQEATVIFCFLLPRTMQTFSQKIWPALKPGTRVISNAFMMETIPATKHKDGVHLYIKGDS